MATRLRGCRRSSSGVKAHQVVTSGNAAFLLHRDGASEQAVVDYIQHYGACTEKQARQSYRFISNPLFRSYVFNYYHGSSPLNRYPATGNRIERFRTLLEQPLTPSRVEHWIAQSNI
jgi:hypothetical protein